MALKAVTYRVHGLPHALRHLAVHHLEALVLLVEPVLVIVDVEVVVIGVLVVAIVIIIIIAVAVMVVVIIFIFVIIIVTAAAALVTVLSAVLLGKLDGVRAAGVHLGVAHIAAEALGYQDKPEPRQIKSLDQAYPRLAFRCNS